MKRRQLLLAGALGAMAPVCAFAQARPVRIGMLAPRPLAESTFSPAIVRRLSELGYRQGSGMVLEYRFPDGAGERFPKLARELLDLKCDLIFAGSLGAARALRDARPAIPVIFIAVDFDPLAQGFVASLRIPGGNMTGVYLRQGAVAAKRLEIARETLPGAKRFLVLADEHTQEQLDAVRKAAEAASVTLTVVEFRKQPYDLAAAFETGLRAGVEALIGLGSPVFAANLGKVSVFLARHRLPAIGSAYAAEAGFLLSYSADHVKAGRRAADLGVRILKGAKPADTPVEQTDEFELVINLKTARALGVKIPHAVLTRAARAIE